MHPARPGARSCHYLAQKTRATACLLEKEVCGAGGWARLWIHVTCLHRAECAAREGQARGHDPCGRRGQAAGGTGRRAHRRFFTTVTAEASASTPLRWSEVRRGLDPGKRTIKTLPESQGRRRFFQKNPRCPSPAPMSLPCPPSPCPLEGFISRHAQRRQELSLCHDRSAPLQHEALLHPGAPTVGFDLPSPRQAANSGNAWADRLLEPPRRGHFHTGHAPGPATSRP
jgi:hypothetical protein